MTDQTTPDADQLERADQMLADRPDLLAHALGMGHETDPQPIRTAFALLSPDEADRVLLRAADMDEA